LLGGAEFGLDVDIDGDNVFSDSWTMQTLERIGLRSFSP